MRSRDDVAAATVPDRAGMRTVGNGSVVTTIGVALSSRRLASRKVVARMRRTERTQTTFVYPFATRTGMQVSVPACKTTRPLRVFHGRQGYTRRYTVDTPGWVVYWQDGEGMVGTWCGEQQAWCGAAMWRKDSVIGKGKARRKQGGRKGVYSTTVQSRLGNGFTEQHDSPA
jgi:hypothetical protein